MTLAKICGLTTPEDVEVAVRAGADAVGLVLAASPRRVDPGLARELLAAAVGVERIAVFRTPTPLEIRAVEDLPFDAVQADAGFDQPPPGWYVLPAYRDAPGVRLPETTATEGLRGAFLLDGPAGGGSGVRADVARAAAAARRGSLVLAGGLDPDNVAGAIAAIRPYAVDVSSGVESRRGVKDPARIEAFLAAVKETR